MSPDSSARSAGSTSEIESAVWPGVVTTRSRSPSTSISSPSASGSRVEAVRRVEGAHRAALAGREVDRHLGVVEVVVGQQHQRDVAGLLVELVDVAVLDRPGVDDDRPRRARLGEHPAVGAVEGHRARGSARAGSAPARRTPRRPRRSRHEPRARRRSSGRRCSGTDSVQPSPSGLDAGGVHLDGPPVRRVDHLGRAGVLRDLQGGEVGRRHHQHLAALGHRQRVAGRQPGDLGRLRRHVAGALPLGQQGHEEPGPVALRLEDRRQPRGPRHRAGRCAAPARDG